MPRKMTLKSAIEANDPDAVHEAMKRVKDINRKLPGTKKPVAYACEKGSDKALQALLEAGAVCEDRRTDPWESPLSVAAEHRQVPIMKFLLQAGQFSERSLEHVLNHSCMEGNTEALEVVLGVMKPEISVVIWRLAALPRNASEVLNLLARYGGNVGARHESGLVGGMTLLHELVYSGRPDVIRTLADLGVDVNARDDLGRTPLMILAYHLSSFEVINARVDYWQPLVDSGQATTTGAPFERVDLLACLQALFDAGADGSLVDDAGNDAIDYCEFEYRRDEKTPDPCILDLLRKAGAKGDPATFALFKAIEANCVSEVQEAIKNGADVNRTMPACDGGPTPLLCARSVEVVDHLLAAGADPNAYAAGKTPLISAADDGNLAIVKRLIEAGADLHAVEVDHGGESIRRNAYLAAEFAEEWETLDYLKSLGAGRPKLTNVQPIKPGVASWNDFSELLVNGTAEEAGRALATVISGVAQEQVYGKSFTPGDRAFVVARPKEMNWCNVFQIAPPPLRFEDPSQRVVLAREIARVSGRSVLCIDYSDTADAASILRVEPDGTCREAHGRDRELLQEMVDAMGEDAPGWAKEQLAGTSEEDLSSTEVLVQLAAREQFVVAAFGIDCAEGRDVDVEFLGHGADAFDGVCFVST